MESRNKIPNSVYEKHLKVKAWNEYTIDYFGLTLEKKTDINYLCIQVKQGNFMIYSHVSAQSYSNTPAEMHLKLQDFLKRYIAAIKQFGVVYNDANFKPPC